MKRQTRSARNPLAAGNSCVPHITPIGYDGQIAGRPHRQPFASLERGPAEAPANRGPHGQVFVRGVIFSRGIMLRRQARTLLPVEPVLSEVEGPERSRARRNDPGESTTGPARPRRPAPCSRAACQHLSTPSNPKFLATRSFQKPKICALNASELFQFAIIETVDKFQGPPCIT